MKRQLGFMNSGDLIGVFFVLVVAVSFAAIGGWEFGKWVITHVSWSIK